MVEILSWMLLGAVLLYVVVALYDANVYGREEEEEEIEIAETKRKQEIFFETIDAPPPPPPPPSAPPPPPPVTPEESLKKAEAYVLDEKEIGDSPDDTAPLLVVKDFIPKTEQIDLDSFIYFKGAKLLIVEDNLLNQRIITSVLKQSGMEIDIAEDGKIALEYLLGEHREYDLVLMDISMPKMDGITATSIIRRAKSFNRLPIVAYTAFGLGDEIAAMFDAGANAYLTKPLEIAQLYTVFMLFIGNVNRGLPLQKQLEMQGLDIEEGIENVHGNKIQYREKLEEFVQRYAYTVDQIPKWIEEKQYERVRLESKEMLVLLKQIGAHDMYQMVHDIQIQFIYKNEHLLDKFKLLYRAKMQALIDTIRHYLETDVTGSEKVLVS